MELLDKFLDYLECEKNYSKHTIAAYKKDVQDFHEYVFNEMELDDLTLVVYSQIRSWVVYLKKIGLSNRSVNRKTVSLKMFYKFLQAVEVVSVNPLAKHIALKVEKKVLTPFSDVEVDEVLEVKKGKNEFEEKRNSLLITLLYTTGIRRAELIGLQLNDINCDEKEIKVLGKRNKERIVPLLDSVLEEIKDYLKIREDYCGDSDYLFVTIKGNKIYPSLVYGVINSYFSEVSSKKKKSPHVLRHSYATELVNAGADLNAVKELLGHTSLAATQVYTHNNLEKLKKVFNQAHPRSAKKT